MSSLKKIAWSGSAVFLALVMALGLMAPTPVSAASVTTLGAVTPLMTTNQANGINTGTVLTTQPILTTAAAATDIPAGTVVIVTAPAGWHFSAQGTATGSATAALFGAGAVGVLAADGLTITYTTTAANGAAETVTWAALAVRPLVESAATGTITIKIGAAAAVTLGTVTRGASFTLPYLLTLTAPASSLPADGSVSTAVTATFSDSAANPVRNTVVNWTVSLGILGTGTSKTALGLSTAATPSVQVQTYRGGGGVATTDTIIASNSTLGVVGTLAMPLTTASGNTAAKVAVNPPTTLAVAATVTNTSPNYQSPAQSSSFSVKVSDAAGLGVNTQTLLITTDKGSVQIGFNAVCGTSKAVTAATASAAPSPGATAEAGIVQLLYCANQNDAPGKATITAQNISTTMANGTASLSMAGRPSKLEPTATGAALSVKVSDTGGNAVADGTPVRFTISQQAGAVSTACTTTTNGAASAVAALIGGSGLVIISTDWNESGIAATCGAAGAQQIATSITVTGGTATTGGTPAAGGTGVLTSGSVPATGFGLIVFSGGTIAQLVTASGVGNTGALYATVGGNFVPYVPGTTIAAVNADFLAAFPGGNVPANTAFVGRK